MIRRQSHIKIVDSAVWTGFLLWIAIFSFITARYDSRVWLQVSAFFYLSVAIGLVVFLAGYLKINRSALHKGLPIIGILCLTIIWLGVQSFLPSGQSVLFDWQANIETPSWFSPELTLSVTPEKTRWLLLSTVLVLTWFVAALALIRSRSRVKQVMWVLGFAAASHAVLGILVMRTGNFLVDASQVDGHFSVARGWYINRNHYAAFLISSVCGALAMLIHGAGKWSKNRLMGRDKYAVLCFGFAIMVAFLAIILSQSRAGLIAPFLSVLLTLLIAKYCRLQLPLGVLTRSFLLVGIGLLGLLVWQGEGFLQRLQNLSVGERILQWQITLEAISGSPWLGYGGGSYASVFQATRGLEELRQVVYNQAHNQYLHLWLEQGLVGLVLWGMVLVLVLIVACKALTRSRSRLERAVILAALVALISASLQAMVDFNLQILNLRVYFFLWVAIIFVVPDIHRVPSERTIKRTLTTS